MNSQALAQAIDELLPQTQCARCGYPGCRPYAEAIAAGKAGINRCPPGGDVTISALARLTVTKPVPLAAECGSEPVRQVAAIDEDWCIGCTVCIQACPVDAIVGAAKLMHTIVRDECTGCGLCVEPCPMYCISMIETSRQRFVQHWGRAQAVRARRRYDARRERRERERVERTRRARLAMRHSSVAEKRRVIEAAVARSRTRRVALAPKSDPR